MGAVPREVREALCAWDHSEEYPLGPPPPPAAAAGFSKTFDLGAHTSRPVCPSFNTQSLTTWELKTHILPETGGSLVMLSGADGRALACIHIHVSLLH